MVDTITCEMGCTPCDLRDRVIEVHDIMDIIVEVRAGRDLL